MKSNLLQYIKKVTHDTSKARSLLELEKNDSFLSPIVSDVALFIPNTLRRGFNYIRNRYVYKTHALSSSKSQIKRGEWVDVGDRIVPCLFEELQGFVEIELAREYDGHFDDNKACLIERLFNIRRAPRSGIDYLEWCMTISPSVCPTQATVAREILDLYVWWTVTRPLREDPYDSVHRFNMMEIHHVDQERAINISESFNRARELEQAQFDEDTEMLTRLIKIRHHLWV